MVCHVASGPELWLVTPWQCAHIIFCITKSDARHSLQRAFFFLVLSLCCAISAGSLSIQKKNKNNNAPKSYGMQKMVDQLEKALQKRTMHFVFLLQASFFIYIILAKDRLGPCHVEQ